MTCSKIAIRSTLCSLWLTLLAIGRPLSALAWLPIHSQFTTITSSQRLLINTQKKGESFILPLLSMKTLSSHKLYTKSTSSQLFLSSAYIPPEQAESATFTDSNKSTKRSLHPQVGDLVRYYELDGGKDKGQTLVGRITFIQKNLAQEKSGWTVEVVELDYIGDGRYVDYPSRSRSSKKRLRDLASVSPIASSWIRNENAWKIPMSMTTTTNNNSNPQPLVRAEQYDIEDYQGPFTGANAINTDVVQADGLIYQALKTKLLRNAAITGLAGTIVADLIKGPEDALIYGAGALASLAYLFFLSLKTDTVGSTQAKFGNNVSNLRFLMPVLVLVGVAFYNRSLGDASPVLDNALDSNGNVNLFSSVTPEQFAAAIIGFLTYRIPLFLTQIQDAFKDSNDKLVLPGSAGIALQALQSSTENANKETTSTTATATTTTVLLVSGPQATGRSDLVQALMASTEDSSSSRKPRLVTPVMLDRNQQGATIERLEQRDEILYIDPTNRYALTKDGIFQAAKNGSINNNGNVVVIDANVDLAKKLTQIAGLRLIGVWVGLDSSAEFENRLRAMIDNGSIPIPEDETREGVIRGKMKEIIKEIEYGITSGIFEFTILNNDFEESLQQLKDASSYCFK